jgi:hypothetical protein
VIPTANHHNACIGIHDKNQHGDAESEGHSLSLYEKKFGNF